MAHIPPQVPPSVAQFLRRDGDWLRCNEVGCGDRAFWGIFRDGDFLRVKVGQHRAKMHAGRPQRAQAGRPQRRAAAEAAQAAPVGGVLVNAAALAALQGNRVGQGVARIGFDMPGTIRKVARPGCEKHNLAEWASYMQAPADVQPWLCPPLLCAADGSWIIVRKAERVGHVDRADHRELCKKLEPLGVRDLHEGNSGYVDGHVVATDYAQGFDGKPCPWVRK